jgi:hypothetical protein
VSDTPKSNVADGRESFDITVGNTLVAFFNRNVSTYATEAGGPKFDLIPVEKQKDIMVNVARMYAQQEYNRITELVNVLQRQAADQVPGLLTHRHPCCRWRQRDLGDPLPQSGIHGPSLRLQVERLHHVLSRPGARLRDGHRLVKTRE